MKQTPLIPPDEFEKEERIISTSTLTTLTNNILSCNRCAYCRTRRSVVVGEGQMDAEVLLCGECPGPDEDCNGRPFIGRAGQLLREMLLSVGVDMNKVFLTNIVRCKPSGKLNPDIKEVKTCGEWLEQQVSIVKPRIILSVGRFSTAYFLGGGLKEINKTKDTIKITKISGKKFKVNNTLVFPVVHPSYILRNHISKDKYLEHFYNFMGAL